MHPKIRNTLLGGLLAAGAMASSQAGTLEYQGVGFTSSWSGNVLTLEIDAAHPTGNWATATTIGALGLKDLGRFGDVELTAAPGGAASWTLSSSELNANGCTGGGHAGKGLCLSGQRIALTDDMVFKFTFSGDGTDLSAPQVKVAFVGPDGNKKVGSLLSQHVVAAVPEPSTYAMMGTGLALLAGLARRRKRL